MKLRFYILTILLFGLPQIANAHSPLSRCASEMLGISKTAPNSLNFTHYYGGADVLGGFTTVDTTKLLTPNMGEALLKAFRKVVPADNSVTQQAFNIRADRSFKGALAEFMYAHSQLTLSFLNSAEAQWKWDTSSILLLNQSLQNEFHNHMSSDERKDQNHQIQRQWGVVSFRQMGTVFQSPSGEMIYSSGPGESAVFNEGALHMSPEKAELRLFLLHFYSRKVQ